MPQDLDHVGAEVEQLIRRNEELEETIIEVAILLIPGYKRGYILPLAAVVAAARWAMKVK